MLTATLVPGTAKNASTLGGRVRVQAPPYYALPDGAPLNDRGDGTFQNTETGEILTPV